MGTILDNANYMADELDRKRRDEKVKKSTYMFAPGFDIKLLVVNTIEKGKAILLVHPEDAGMVTNAKK